jgi:ribosomal protein S18 acetylase RimI-like enzyme
MQTSTRWLPCGAPADCYVRGTTADIDLCRRTASSALFVGALSSQTDEPTLVASVMTGSDGHRGWLYYLAVAPALRRKGLAWQMVRYAETWLAAQGIRKVELMIRDDDESVRASYEKIGYTVERRIVMSRWLSPYG